MTASVAIPPGGKSPEAFRTISEAAAELDVPQHVLRFWESRFSQIRPLKRAGGRRFYRPQDVELLRGIRTLLYHEGYTIKGVQKVLRERGVRHVAEIGRIDAGALNETYISSRDLFDDSTVEALPARARMPRAAADTGDGRGDMDAAQRARLEELLRELLELKERLLRSH